MLLVSISGDYRRSDIKENPNPINANEIPIDLYFSIFFGLIISFSFAAGCTCIIVALQHKSSIANYFQKVQKYLGLKQEPKSKPVDCDICGIIKCNRHLTVPDREPWRRLFISNELNEALASVCSMINSNSKSINVSLLTIHF